MTNVGTEQILRIFAYKRINHGCQYNSAICLVGRYYNRLSFYEINRLWKYLYTGDAVSVKIEEDGEVITAGLGILPGIEHYGLILDNHALPIPDGFGRKIKLYYAGSMFYDLNPYMQSLDINGICCSYAQSRCPKDVIRLQIKSSPCLAQTDLEWRMAKILGLYE